MSLFINNGLTGLLAAQRALQTTSNNVANANTDGYVRQRVNFGENPGREIGGFSVGTGVNVAGIERIYDQFLGAELNSATMSQHRAQTFNTMALRLDGLLGNPDLNISPSIQRFFDQVELLNRDPTSAVNRQQLLAEAESLTQRFHQMNSQLAGIADEVDSRLRESVNTINNLAASIATVNDRIALSGDNVPNDLLDEQGRLMTQLAEQVDFTAVKKANGTFDLMVGSGQPLVLGTLSFELALIPNEFDGSQLELAYNDGNQLQLISNRVAGGAVAGLMSFRNDTLNAVRRDLGQVAVGMSVVFNSQHREGIDLNGDLGGDFFANLAPAVAGSANNTGAANVTAVIGDASAVEAKDYVLRFDGAAWQLFDAGTGAPKSMTGSGTGADPFIAGGLEITVGGAAAAGDRFLLQPVAQSAGKFDTLVTNPSMIAAAGPLTASVSLQNSGNATLSPITIADATNPGLLQPVDIRFDDAATYRIYDTGGADLTGPLAYTSGADISFNGFTVQISGAPTTGDTFSIGPSGAGSGDNGNGLALAAIGSQGFFANGQQSIDDLSASILTSIGSTAARSSQDLLVQSALREQIELDLESVSGVNLEEEAANLLRYQEAYLASSKIIGIANDLFQTLLGVVGR
ncbi:MAG: flagellar hook-associated protein FlgK [Gammaproteobacteria bacterium]|nr:flagellar hook-associated protein FlgK [Gammaproteobacteria bacterium]